MSYDVLFKKVAEAISKRDITQAERLVSENPLTEKNPLLYRAHYMVLSLPNSTMSDMPKARALLREMADSFTDAWPSVELARVLISERKDLADVDQAEDLLNRHREKDIMAKYWLAEIYSKGLNSDSKGKPVFDLKEAITLYKEIMPLSSGRLKSIAVERYCQVAMELGNLSGEQEMEIFGLLSQLSRENHLGAKKELGRFMLKQIKEIVLALPSFADKTESKIVDNNKCLNAIDTIELTLNT